MDTEVTLKEAAARYREAVRKRDELNAAVEQATDVLSRLEEQRGQAMREVQRLAKECLQVAEVCPT